MQQNAERQDAAARTLIGRVIAWSVGQPLIVCVLAATLAVAGWLVTRDMPLDAIPDLTDTQVIVRTDFPGQSPQIIEDLVTYPLSSTLLGLPRTRDVRGVSMFGTSFVYIIFEDDVDLYWARARVAEALSQLGTTLPAAAQPRIGPDATGAGWVYQYALVDDSGTLDLAQLRSLQDWFIKIELSGVDGVAEVASVGGFVREYQVLIDPNRLRAFDVPISRIAEAVRAASQEVGGRVLEQGETEYVIRSTGYVQNRADLESVVVFAANGAPVTLKDVARIVEGPALRRGIVELDGLGETVAGIVIMRDGENALRVIERVRNKLARLQAGLPDGVRVVPVYDRAPLIQGSIDYLRNRLLEEGLIVALVIGLFLLHWRASLVALVTLPLAVLGALLVMAWQGITANIMSLGGIAIAIGAMVDAAIIMVENAVRYLSQREAMDPAERRAGLINASQEVGRGVFFSLLIITVSFLPVLALTGESYRLFAPLAFTKTYAMAFSALLAVTLVPVLIVFFVRGRARRDEDNPLNRLSMALYRPSLALALRHRWSAVLVALFCLASVIWPATQLGSEFMPPLDEGELLYMPTTLPGASATKMREVLGQTHRLIKTIPEVEQVFGKAGRADTATDPAPLTMIESWIRLKPKTEWRDGMTTERLIETLNQRLNMPGLVNSWGFPIKTRMDMVSTGVRTPVGIKLSGDDLGELDRLARAVERAVANVPGTRSALAERVLGGQYLEITPNRSELARRNIDLGTFQSVVRTALGGLKLAESVEGRERYDIILRYDRAFRETADDLENVLVPSPDGAHIPLKELAAIGYTQGPPMIRSENARLNGWVFVDLATTDLGGYVARARETVDRAIDLPPGYTIEWSGQYRQFEKSRAQLTLAVPAVCLLVLLLLLLYFGRLDRPLIVLTSLPFALVGALWSVWFAGYNLSVAVAVGLIALVGIAVETAVVMLLYIDQQVDAQRPTDRAALNAAIQAGAVLRLRPKLMTVVTIIAALLPVFITDGPGADLMRRIALPMLGGVLSTLFLTLYVIPVLYALWVGRDLPPASD